MFEPRVDQKGGRMARSNKGGDENVRVKDDTHGSAPRSRGPVPVACAHARDSLGNFGIDGLDADPGVAGPDSGESSHEEFLAHRLLHEARQSAATAPLFGQKRTQALVRFA